MTAEIAEEDSGASFITGQDDVLSQTVVSFTDDETAGEPPLNSDLTTCFQNSEVPTHNTVKSIDFYSSNEDAHDTTNVSVPESQGGTTGTDFLHPNNERDFLSSEERIEERKKIIAGMRKYVAKSRISSNPNNVCIAKFRRPSTPNQENKNKWSSATPPTSTTRLKMSNFVSAMDVIDYADKLTSAKSKMGSAPTPSSSSQRTRIVHDASSVSSCSISSTPNQEYKNKRSSAATPPTSPTRLYSVLDVGRIGFANKLTSAKSKLGSALPQFCSHRTSKVDTRNAKTEIANSPSSQSSAWNSKALQKTIRPVIAKAPAGTAIMTKSPHSHLTNSKGASSRKDGSHDLHSQTGAGPNTAASQSNKEPKTTRGVPITSMGRRNFLIHMKAARNSPQVCQIPNVKRESLTNTRAGSTGTNDSAGLRDRVPSLKEMEKTAKGAADTRHRTSANTRHRTAANTRHRTMILKKLREERRKLEIARLSAEAKAQAAMIEENEKRIKIDYEGLLSFYTKAKMMNKIEIPKKQIDISNIRLILSDPRNWKIKTVVKLLDSHKCMITARMSDMAQPNLISQK